MARQNGQADDTDTGSDNDTDIDSQARTGPGADDAIARAAPTAETFMLYAARGRVFGSNVRQKLIDLGSIDKDDDGTFNYELDGDHERAHGFASEEEALRDIGDSISFLYLDGQFTALADVRGPEGPDLDGVPQLEITLDELGEDEQAINVNV